MHAARPCSRALSMVLSLVALWRGLLHGCGVNVIWMGWLDDGQLLRQPHLRPNHLSILSQTQGET